MKICQFRRLHMKVICWGFYIQTPFTFWDMRTWNMWKVCLQTFRINRICQKLIYFLRNLKTSRVNNSRVLRIKNAKFSGYCFYMNTNIERDFQFRISVPLSTSFAFAKIRSLIKYLNVYQVLHWSTIYVSIYHLLIKLHGTYIAKI